jgi:hypothetical protein
VLDAVDVSTTVCVDQRFHDPPGQSVRRTWDERLDRIIPTPHQFNTSVFLAAFHPEIINLAALFCTPALQPTARHALHSSQHLDAVTRRMNQAIGRDPDGYRYATNYETTTWIHATTRTPSVNPTGRFPLPDAPPSTAPRTAQSWPTRTGPAKRCRSSPNTGTRRRGASPPTPGGSNPTNPRQRTTRPSTTRRHPP